MPLTCRSDALPLTTPAYATSYIPLVKKSLLPYINYTSVQVVLSVLSIVYCNPQFACRLSTVVRLTYRIWTSLISAFSLEPGHPH
jgi:hypothetical protein